MNPEAKPFSFNDSAFIIRGGWEEMEGEHTVFQPAFISTEVVFFMSDFKYFLKCPLVPFSGCFFY